MLIIPLVENVFKHGIDKRREDNYIFLQLMVQEKQLTVTVRNRVMEPVKNNPQGTGLVNLRNRLQLLYGEMYSLDTMIENDHYTSVLSLPL
jgi:LytS/YehU family sensor histidine kinase